MSRAIYKSSPTYRIDNVQCKGCGIELRLSKQTPGCKQCLTYNQEGAEDVSTDLPKLSIKSPSSCTCPSLHAVTKLDLSNKGLKHLPLYIFQMPSLKVLILSQNQLESLPDVELYPVPSAAPPFSNKMKKSHSYSVSLDRAKSTGLAWQLPFLEELHLQDNRLETVPACIFDLPSLQLLDLSNNKIRNLPYPMWFAPKLRDLNLSMNLLRDLPMRKMTQHAFPGQSPSRKKSSSVDSDTESPSPSVGRQPSKDTNEDIEDLTAEAQNTRLQVLKHINLWTAEINVTSTSYLDEQLLEKTHCKLVSLNLSRNGFTTMPIALSCMATSLTRLNMSYNCLTTIGSVKLFPSNLKHLDLSFNQLNSWSRVCLESIDALCCLTGDIAESLANSSPAVSKTKSRNIYCIHKQHNRLDNLRSLILTNNHLSCLNLLSDVTETVDDFEQIDVTQDSKQSRHSKLLFPNLSMLDVSNNNIREIPLNIAELTNLSVLHLSGNQQICHLPPQMGLLNKLWNLTLRGCNLNDPFKSMVESKKYKTMDIIGYLKSILEDARPYARMKLMVVGVQGIGKTSLLEALRQEGSGSYRRRPPEHWGKRMGNKNLNMKTPKGVTLSTVGVDVCDWIYDKKPNNGPSLGPVTFRTWDFGGQKEYYSTHQYFLSKRSLYLVVWKMIDGEKAVDGIQQWLVNIQARAPNAPVIIVGTHYDLIKEFFPPFYSQELQATIRERFINVIDPDKCGLPRVVDSIEISVKTKHNVKLLCNLIYDTVFGLRTPGSKERLLEQRIPATYLALEDVIGYLVAERRAEGKDPVLRADDYREMAMAEMQKRFRIQFRDVMELQQATTFLHHNGVLLHYEDSTLKDLYFLDPQWLCDILAHVVTIREINPYARNGVMQIEDLKHLFKASSCAPVDTRTYIINLLNKFEVALTWDSRTLLIPSLLPTELSLTAGAPGCDVRIPVRSRGWALRGSKSLSTESRPIELAVDPKMSVLQIASKSIYRLLLMRYFPSGFWSRLMTRILGDDFIIDIIRSYFKATSEAMSDPFVVSILNKKAEWTCWQTGLSLRYAGTLIFRVKEVIQTVQNQPMDYRQQVKFMLMNEYDEKWIDLELQKSSILEIYIPSYNIQIETQQGMYSIEPNRECIVKLLALTVDHIDTLLEDWYPSLGTRFVHTSEGKFLVTRLVPCIECLVSHVAVGTSQPPSIRESPTDTLLGPCDEGSEVMPSKLHSHSVDSVHSRNTSRENDIGYESACSTPSKMSRDAIENQEGAEPVVAEVFTFLIEECMLRASEDKSVNCPVHGDLDLKLLAPDTVFIDVGEHHLVNSDHVQRDKLLGRGAFGFVFKAIINQGESEPPAEVAMKMLQPVDPGQRARQSDHIAFKIARNNWERDPMQYACKAYCTARQELNILLTLKHQHIVSLLGVCVRPLAIILSLAPVGALDMILREYRRAGLKVNPFTSQKVLLQVSRALEYLHQQHIIYRDLKSENVLVWKIPTPFDEPDNGLINEVDVRLADYGISRNSLPTGTKGFGGTEGFMAPEIMRHNGEEEYTEKVDCFSFGMFIYELISLHLPFEGQECVKDHILDGGRPSLSPRDLVYPSYVYDLMALCWSEAAKDRPAASQIVSIITAPEFIHMLDVVSLAESYALLSAVVVQKKRANHFEAWLTRVGKQTDVLYCNENCWQDYKSIVSLDNNTITASCVVDDLVYLGDSKAYIHIYTSDLAYFELEKLRLDPEDNTPTAVRSIVYSKSINTLAVSSTSGRLWIINRSQNYSLREIGNNDVPFLSVACLDLADGEAELWCGQTEGRICVISIKNNTVTSQEVLNHYADGHTPIMERFDVFDTVAEYPNVWTYLYPGCVVYNWNVITRKQVSKLDCSKLAPCSESLMSISIEEHLSPGKCQVTAMAVNSGELLIGTTWGCLVIVEGPSMRPITVFRPHEGEIKAIIPFEAPLNEYEHDIARATATSLKETHNDVATTQAPNRYFMTVGKGFRSLVSRYIYLPKEKRAMLSQKGIYAILWKTGNWLT